MPIWSEAGAIFSEPEEFELAREEWSEVWKKYFKIIHIADNLVIRPSWLEYTAQPGQAVVNIDPGMSFGTGQHATTAYCLKVLALFPNGISKGTLQKTDREVVRIAQRLVKKSLVPSPRICIARAIFAPS